MAILSTASRINVHTFGALGNGVADDTAILQQAIDHGAPTASVIYLPRGTYKISKPLELRSNVTLMGESANSTILKQDDLDQHVIQIAKRNEVVSNVVIANLTVTHDQATYVNRLGAGIGAGQNSSAWQRTTDVRIRDVIIRDVARQAIQAWKEPKRWSLLNVDSIRCGGGGPYFVHGDEIAITGGRTEETGDDAIQLALSTQNVSIVGHVIKEAGTLTGSPGGEAISIRGGRHIAVAGVSIFGYENAAFQIEDDHSGVYKPNNVVISGCTVRRAASLDTASSIAEISGADGPIVFVGCTIDGYNYVTESVEQGFEVRSQNPGGRATFIGCDIYGVHRGFQLRSVNYVEVHGCNIETTTTGIEVVEGNTVDELRVLDSRFYGDGASAISFQAGSGATITELFTRNNRSKLSSSFLNIPTGQTVTLADMFGDLQDSTSALVNNGGTLTKHVVLSTGAAPTGDTLGSVTNYIEVHDSDGTSLGKVPIYDDITTA